MSVTTVTDSNYWKTPTTVATSSTSGSNTLNDMDSFLQLLATELQYQDPTDPVSNTEYVSQLAQMSSLMQIQTITASIEATQAYSMIDKTVSYEVASSTTGTTTSGSGVVQSVIVSGDKIYLNVDGTLIEKGYVTSVNNG